MKKLLTVMFLACCLVSRASNDMRLVLDRDESRSIQIGGLPGVGIVAFLDGDSLMSLDDAELPVIHIPAIKDARQVLITDSAFYCVEDNYICRLDLGKNELHDVAVLDNDRFTLYPACGNSFFAVTADEDFSNCLLFDPESGTYSKVLDYPGPIRKMVASRDHVFAWIDESVCLVGGDEALATLITDPALNDIVLTPHGLVAANSEGLWLIVSPSDVRLISRMKAGALWFVGNSLYLLHESGCLIAVDNFSPGEKRRR